MKNMIKQS